ncbi:hypothetical protein [Butyricimonas faecihominis]|uniref:hypothetical protein n=1 Tax=Butyricimonas faecihominis TaxID=1472416 RepID=UPI0026DCB105|nr:hypothetical protein [Butyricimonas faecihominis]
MAKKQAYYIFCDTAKAAGAGILQESRRKSVDGSRVILHEDDFKLYFPVINEETGEVALTLEDKVKTVDGRILTTSQAQREVQGDKWNDKNEDDE